MATNGQVDDAMDVDNEPSTSSKPPPPVVQKPRASSEPYMPPPRFTVGYVFDAQMMTHICINGHPEQPQRIMNIFQILQANGCIEKMKYIPIRKVRREEAMLVHGEDHWDKVMAISRLSPQDIEDSLPYYSGLSLYVNANTSNAACLSCGGAIEATLAVARGELQKSFAIVRPPGHHAEPDEHMGFCFFNNVAVAARVAQQLTPCKKILILDWDVHHGNGTQKAFNDDPTVLYISLHRYDGGQFYPSTTFGAMTSCGEGEGLGFSVNIPWPTHGMTDGDYLHAFQRIVMPIAMEFAPDLVIISAGFDAAKGDDLGECEVSPQGYAHMTHMLASLAGGKLVVALEGGYNLISISNSSLAVAQVLLGEAPGAFDKELVASEFGTETVWQVAREQSKYWKSIDPKACEPKEDYGVERVFSIPEILKAHRQYYLQETHKMLTIPLLPELEERFAAQVMCTSDVLDNEIMVVLVHEFGELRVELEGAMSCDLHMEHSYLVDCSKSLIEWVKTQGYALIDINMLEKRSKQKPLRAQTNSLSRNLLTYTWDNYIHLSKAKKIVFIGHNGGCDIIMETIKSRRTSVMRTVQAVVQVMGNAKIPGVPTDEVELLEWYKQRSTVFVPVSHQIHTRAKALDRHGHVVSVKETRALRVMLRALPAIQKFLELQLGPGTGAGAEAPVADVTGAIDSVHIA